MNEEEEIEEVAVEKATLKEWVSLIKSSLQYENIIKLMPVFLLVFAFCIAFIYKNHHVAKTVRDISELNKEMKELRAEESAIKFDLMNQSRQSKIAEKLEGSGVKELVTPPYKLKKKKK